MKALLITKTAIGGGAAVLIAGLVAAAPAAQAHTGRTLPCKTHALIAAIKAANNRGGARINLAPGCTYRLTTASSPNKTLGDTGLPVITSRITLTGFHTRIAGNDSTFRILMVTRSGKLTLNGLTITGGRTSGPGGGIFNLEGTLILNHSRVTRNSSGGGMMAAGGGIASGTMHTGPIGKAVLNFSSVDHNTTTNSAGGILNHAGTLILNASRVADNTAAEGGGGIASGTGGQGGPRSSILVVKFSLVSGNAANGGPMAGAGGISNGGTAAITGSVIYGNTAPGGAGGGILNHGVLTIKASTVRGNTAPTDRAGNHGNGGGIANINLAPVAPGAVNGGILTIAFSRISGNTASGAGGGIFEATITKKGPSAGGPLTLKFSKVTGNKAGQGGGIFAVPGSPVKLKSTVIARNIPDNCAPPGVVPGCKG